MLGALAGLLAAAVALGAGELVAGVVGPASSPVVAVGNAVIALTPEPVKDAAIADLRPGTTRSPWSRARCFLLAGVRGPDRAGRPAPAPPRRRRHRRLRSARRARRPHPAGRPDRSTSCRRWWGRRPASWRCWHCSRRLSPAGRDRRPPRAAGERSTDAGSSSPAAWPSVPPCSPVVAAGCCSAASSSPASGPTSSCPRPPRRRRRCRPVRTSPGAVRGRHPADHQRTGTSTASTPRSPFRRSGPATTGCPRRHVRLAPHLHAARPVRPRRPPRARHHAHLRLERGRRRPRGIGAVARGPARRAPAGERDPAGELAAGLPIGRRDDDRGAHALGARRPGRDAGDRDERRAAARRARLPGPDGHPGPLRLRVGLQVADPHRRDDLRRVRRVLDPAASGPPRGRSRSPPGSTPRPR